MRKHMHAHARTLNYHLQKEMGLQPMCFISRRMKDGNKKKMEQESRAKARTHCIPKHLIH